MKSKAWIIFAALVLFLGGGGVASAEPRVEALPGVQAAATTWPGGAYTIRGQNTYRYSLVFSQQGPCDRDGYPAYFNRIGMRDLYPYNNNSCNSTRVTGYLWNGSFVTRTYYGATYISVSNTFQAVNKVTFFRY